MTDDNLDFEQEHVLERLEQIQEDIRAVQSHPMVDDFAADDALDMARSYIDEAKVDVRHAGEEE